MVYKTQNKDKKDEQIIKAVRFSNIPKNKRIIGIIEKAYSNPKNVFINRIRNMPCKLKYLKKELFLI